MKNLDFILSLPNEMFVVSGSYGIKLQCNEFREYKDIDIIIKSSFMQFAILKAKSEGVFLTEIGDYELEVVNMNFNDGSKIDCIVYNKLPENTILKGTFNGSHRPVNVLPINEICKHKASILKQYKKTGEDYKYKKHMEDLAFLLSKGFIFIK